MDPLYWVITAYQNTLLDRPISNWSGLTYPLLIAVVILILFVFIQRLKSEILDEL